MAYATLAELKSELDLGDSDVDEVLMQRKLDEAQRIIDRVTERVFEAAMDEIRLIDYEEGKTVDGRKLILPEDLCQITSVTNGDGVTVTFDEFVTVPRLRSVGAEVTLPDSPQAWPWWAIQLKANSGKRWTYDTDPEEAISVVGRWAFSVSAPADVKGATIRLADWLYHQKDSLADREESEVGQDGVLLLMGDLPKSVQARLMSYVRVVP